MGFVCDVMRPHNSDLKRYFYVTLGLNISQYSPILGEISVVSWGSAWLDVRYHVFSTFNEFWLNSREWVGKC